jgi:hypothetical protein
LNKRQILRKLFYTFQLKFHTTIYWLVKKKNNRNDFIFFINWCFNYWWCTIFW